MPSAATYSALKAARVRSASRLNSEASPSRPSRAATSARIRAERYRQAVATTPGSALARHGWSGGASGSSQSPNWKPSSHTPGGRQLARHPAHVRAHRVVLPLEHRRVAVRLVERPRHPHRRVAPDRRGVHRRQPGRGRHPLEHVGHHERHQPVRVPLLQVEVDQPVLEEGRHVVEVGRRRREHGEVAGPAEPLVALRAVGRYVEEVPAQAPDDVAVQLGEQRVGALEGAGPRAGRSGRRRPRATSGSSAASRSPRRTGTRGR